MMGIEMERCNIFWVELERPFESVFALDKFIFALREYLSERRPCLCVIGIQGDGFSRRRFRLG